MNSVHSSDSGSSPLQRPPASERVQKVLKAREYRPRPLQDFCKILFGTALAAICFNVLLRPNFVAPGGVVGLSLVLQPIVGWEPAFVQWGFNAVILLLGLRWFGIAFAMRSLTGMVALPAFVLLSRDWPALTDNILLAAIAGGAGLGIGLGTVFRANGSVGGFSTLALAFHRFFAIPVDRGIMMLDGLVVAGALLVFTPEQVLSALICITLTGRIARGVLTGVGNSKVALIVSARSHEITERVLEEIPLGVTKLSGSGAYTGDQREILMIVMRPAETVRLKRLVREIDADAFMIMCDTLEVLGYGFKPHQ
ncbi:MAG: YitT family protein [Verrucomicrobiota bacterium JB023]|nr:YitT family protein [Verrucomicrobiota bacterium JB023]